MFELDNLISSSEMTVASKCDLSFHLQIVVVNSCSCFVRILTELILSGHRFYPNLSMLKHGQSHVKSLGKGGCFKKAFRSIDSFTVFTNHRTTKDLYKSKLEIVVKKNTENVHFHVDQCNKIHQKFMLKLI